MPRFRLVPEVYLFLIENSHILLSRRYQTGYEDGRYSVISGHVDGNEPASLAVIREANEEAGLAIAPSSLHLCHVLHRRSDRESVGFFFQCSDWRDNPYNREPNKCDDLSWFPINSLPKNIIPYIRQVITLSLNGQKYSEFGWQD